MNGPYTSHVHQDGDNADGAIGNERGPGLTNATTVHQARAAFALLVFGLILAGPAAAPAQETDIPADGGFCFRPDASADCDWFPITEFGVAFRESYERIWVLGLAHTLNHRFALGGTVAFTDDSGITVTLAPLVRVNLTRDLFLDIAPGVMISGSSTLYLPDERPSPDVRIQSTAQGMAPGFALDVSLSLKDWVVPFARRSVLPYDQVSRWTYTQVDAPGVGTSWLSPQSEEIVQQSGTITEYRFGVRAGSYAGLGLGVLAVVVSAVMYGFTEGGN